MRWNVLVCFGLALCASTAFAQATRAPTIDKVSVDLEQVRVEFRQPMLTWDTRADTAVLRTEPALPCRWYWEDDTVLLCEGPGLGAALKGATRYRIVVGPGLWTQAGAAFPPVTLETEMARPEIGEYDTLWKAGVPSVRLWAYPSPVQGSPASVLDVRVNDATVPFTVEPVGDPDDGTFALQVPGLAAMRGTLSVRVRPGLRSVEGPLPGVQHKVLKQVRLGEPFRLREIECYSTDDGRSGKRRAIAVEPVALGTCSPRHAITLTFSRPLDDAGLAALRAALPAGWTAEQTDEAAWSADEPEIEERRGAEVQVEPAASRDDIALALPTTITSRDGAHLVATPPITLSIGDFADSVVFAPPLLKTAPGDAALPQASALNVAGLLEVTRVAIGARTKQDRFTLPAAGERNAKVALPLPQSPDAVREGGGLVLAGAAKREDVAYGVAYAPFAVLAREVQDDRALIWVSRWGEAQGLADADVELLWLDQRHREHVADRTRTDVDGLAWLDVPKDAPENAGGLGWLVRVTRDDLRTVAPLEQGMLEFAYSERASWRWDERDDALLLFGVTDRLLYRPGDTVNYRVWWRAPKGNHLLPRAAPQRLELHALERNKTLRDWPVVDDASGGLSGALELPARLEDGTYCVRAAGENERWGEDPSGACFQVARFEAQPVWASLAVDRSLARTGDTLVFDAGAGFYSGGPAPGAALAFEGLLRPRRVNEVYPQYARYTFLEAWRQTPMPVFIPAEQARRADASGAAQVRYRVPTFSSVNDDPVGIAQLEVSVGASAAGRATANSAPTVTTIAHYPRFVGLASDSWWLGRDADPVFDVVVVTHAGDAVAGAPVAVRIEKSEYSRWWDPNEYDAPLREDAAAIGHCALVAGRKQVCPFRAPEPGWYRFVASAADAAPTELVLWVGAKGWREDEEKESSTTLALVRPADATTPARVRLDQPYARALALFVLEYQGVRRAWVRPLTGTGSEIDVPLEAAWAPGVTLRVLVRSADGDATAFATPTLGATIDLAIARPDIALLVDVAPAPARPGQEVVVRLHNPTGADRHATITLVDDSVHQQAGEAWDLMDPRRADWLGLLDRWSIGDWHGLEALAAPGNPFANPEHAWLSLSDLDSIVVTGARIRSAEEMFETGVRTRPLAPGARTTPGRALARVRQRFLDTAYWNPDVPVPAGVTRELSVPLPDNLTRWRVLVWTSDAGDGFALTEATVASELPVELRLGVPARLFTGDRALATVAARNHSPGAATLALELQVDGAGVHVDEDASGLVAAGAELTHRARLAPTTTGDVQLVARADTAADEDAVAAGIPVHAPVFEDRLVQLGWIDAATLNLQLPGLPEGAVAKDLALEVRQGVGGWLDGWLADLREYPHRCWEQSLTRALGAAIAVAAGKPAADWPEAATLAPRTLAEAAGFQDGEGRFHYFAARDGDRRDGYTPRGGYMRDGSPLLSAWTLRAFDQLRALGHEVPKPVYAPLELAVAKDAVAPIADVDTRKWEAAAVASGALADPARLDHASLERLWARWDDLSWHARGELVRALARKPTLATQARAGIGRLRAAGTPHGLRQVVGDTRDWSWAMGSGLRDQCSIVAALFDLDTDPAGAPQRFALLRGVADLYAGGTRSLDTQSSIQCVLALRAAAATLPRGSAQARAVEVALGQARATLTLPDDESPVHWTTAAPFAGTALRVRGPDAVDPTLNLAATVRYTLDARVAPAQAVGLRLDRTYAVFRAGQWRDAPVEGVREGEWVRVSLRVAVPAWRHFVAITDPVPGGLVTRDLTLAGIGDAALRDVGDAGSWWFDTRQTGATEVRLYAEKLPPGTHVVHYFAQAVHPGEYLAPPAVAELMYGRGSRATTRGDTVRIGVAK